MVVLVTRTAAAPRTHTAADAVHHSYASSFALPFFGSSVLTHLPCRFWFAFTAIHTTVTFGLVPTVPVLRSPPRLVLVLVTFTFARLPAHGSVPLLHTHMPTWFTVLPHTGSMPRTFCHATIACGYVIRFVTLRTRSVAPFAGWLHRLPLLHIPHVWILPVMRILLVRSYRTVCTVTHWLHMRCGYALGCLYAVHRFLIYRYALPLRSRLRLLLPLPYPVGYARYRLRFQFWLPHTFCLRWIPTFCGYWLQLDGYRYRYRSGSLPVIHVHGYARTRGLPGSAVTCTARFGLPSSRRYTRGSRSRSLFRLVLVLRFVLHSLTLVAYGYRSFTLPARYVYAFTVCVLPALQHTHTRTTAVCLPALRLHSTIPRVYRYHTRGLHVGFWFWFLPPLLRTYWLRFACRLRYARAHTTVAFTAAVTHTRTPFTVVGLPLYYARLPAVAVTCGCRLLHTVLLLAVTHTHAFTPYLYTLVCSAHTHHAFWLVTHRWFRLHAYGLFAHRILLFTTALVVFTTRLVAVGYGWVLPLVHIAYAPFPHVTFYVPDAAHHCRARSTLRLQVYTVTFTLRLRFILPFYSSLRLPLPTARFTPLPTCYTYTVYLQVLRTTYRCLHFTGFTRAAHRITPPILPVVTCVRSLHYAFTRTYCHPYRATHGSRRAHVPHTHAPRCYCYYTHAVCGSAVIAIRFCCVGYPVLLYVCVLQYRFCGCGYYGCPLLYTRCRFSSCISFTFLRGFTLPPGLRFTA